MYDIFFINLDRHEDRRRFMDRQMAALGLSATRLPAVNGYDPAAIARNAAASFCTLPQGEIGCYESHRAFWRIVVERDLPGAIVLEDDVVVSSDFAGLAFPDEVLADCDVIKLDTFPRPCLYGSRQIPLGKGRHLQRLLGSERSTGAYFVTRRGAERLLKLTENYFIPVDFEMFGQFSKTFWTLTEWKVVPAMAAQLRFCLDETDLPPEMADSIQAKRQRNIDPRGVLTARRRAALWMRRLTDWDFAAVRDRRTRRALAAFARQEDIVEDTIHFHTASRDHFEHGLALME